MPARSPWSECRSAPPPWSPLAQPPSYTAEPDWAEATRFLEQTVKAGNQDANALYLLAMAYKHQGRSGEADADFQQGAERERRNQPNPGVVDASLERLPGDARAAVNRARGRI